MKSKPHNHWYLANTTRAIFGDTRQQSKYLSELLKINEIDHHFFLNFAKIKHLKLKTIDVNFLNF